MSDLQNDDRENGDEVTEELTSEQEQLAKKEADIQFLKGKWGEEKAELRRELETLKQQQYQFEGRINEQRDMQNPKEQAVDPYEFDDEAKEKFGDDPFEIINFLKGRESDIKREQSELVNLVVEALKEQDSSYKSELTGLRKEIDPELQAWKPAIQELRQNEKLKSLDDEQLIEIAKMRDMKPLMEYRGASGGQRGRESEQKARPFDSNSAGGQMLMKMFSGDAKRAQSAWDRAEAKKGSR